VFGPVAALAAAEEPRRCIGPVTDQTTIGVLKTGSVPTLPNAVIVAALAVIAARRFV
jgi:hypothetical protein